MDTYLIIAVLLGWAVTGWLAFRRPKPDASTTALQCEALARLAKLLELAQVAATAHSAAPQAPPSRPRPLDGPVMVEILKVHHDGRESHYCWAREGTPFHLAHASDPNFAIRRTP